MKQLNLRLLSGSFLPLLLSACHGGLLTTVGPDYQTAPLPTAANWQAPQPDGDNLPVAHQGDAKQLKQWWAGFQDPALNQFLAAAQQVSASVADAKVRIEQARANLIGAESSLLPSLDFSSGVNRSSTSFGGTPFVWNKFPIGLQSSWEIDLFGGLARQKEVADRQLEAKNATWHDARVAVAVEVGNAYLDYRYCEAQLQTVQANTASRQQTARLTKIAGDAGFSSPADVALANASTAEGQQTLLQQQARCEIAIKSLVALTGLLETQVRLVLSEVPERIAKLPQPAKFRIDVVPARVLLQRPDLAAAEREVAEASAKIGVEQAKRFPRLSLSGNITPTLQNINGAAFLWAQTWSIGPTLSLPLFDQGKRAADVEVAKVQYQAAESKFRSQVRTAVKEVEEALVRLDSVGKSLPEARQAVAGYGKHFQAMQELYQVGLGSLLDVETARRNSLMAQMTVTELEKEQVSAWIALYRAAGGSWNDAPENSAIFNHNSNQAEFLNQPITTQEKK